MNKQSKFSGIIKEVIKDIGKFYPFFLLFYVVAIIVTHASHAWDRIFYWPAFHAAIGFMTFVAGLYFWRKIKEISKEQGKAIQEMSFMSFRKLTSVARALYKKVWAFLGNIGLMNYIKSIIVIIVLAFSSIITDPFTILVLGYGLISVLWGLQSRIPALLALCLLVMIPILLAFKAEALAEYMAVFAFYFLVIMVATAIREYRTDMALPGDNL